ncbi:unnamed protein product [Allacma fusca]|uniref:Uncharacterized protein n=1 Tax=Allacma fusca TaxID=39272 RepID=A0A8J2KH21_9HEXA|nr:unnamed protein product [Allacma fusca]
MFTFFLFGKKVVTSMPGQILKLKHLIRIPTMELLPDIVNVLSRRELELLKPTLSYSRKYKKNTYRVLRYYGD